MESTSDFECLKQGKKKKEDLQIANVLEDVEGLLQS
jgi:hypothetical protein